MQPHHVSPLFLRSTTNICRALHGNYRACPSIEIVASVAAHCAGSCGRSAVLTLRDWPVLQHLMVAEGAACADLHSAPVSLHGDVRIEVRPHLVAKRYSHGYHDSMPGMTCTAAD